jgi:hypothetical protein
MPVNQMPIKIKNLKYFEPKVSKVPITQQPTKWALPHQIPTKIISKNQTSSLLMSEGRLNGQGNLSKVNPRQLMPEDKFTVIRTYF